MNGARTNNANLGGISFNVSCSIFVIRQGYKIMWQLKYHIFQKRF